MFPQSCPKRRITQGGSGGCGAPLGAGMQGSAATQQQLHWPSAGLEVELQ